MYKELATSTLLRMTKRDIIERLRCAEHNANAYKATLEQQIKNVEDWDPVVRCKDCKYLGFRGMEAVCEHVNIYGIIKPWDYCSRGERRINTDD